MNIWRLPVEVSGSTVDITKSISVYMYLYYNLCHSHPYPLFVEVKDEDGIYKKINVIFGKITWSKKIVKYFNGALGISTVEVKKYIYLNPIREQKF